MRRGGAPAGNKSSSMWQLFAIFVRVRLDEDRYSPVNLYPVLAQRRNLPRVVRQKLDALQLQASKHVRGRPVVPLVVPEAKRHVRLDRVVAEILELVRLHLVQQADPAPFLSHVEQDAAAERGDELKRRRKLRPAVAAPRAERVPRQALGVHPDRNLGLAVRVALDERQMLLSVDGVVESDDLKVTEDRGQLRDGRDRYAELLASACELPVLREQLGDLGLFQGHRRVDAAIR
jgi:hypothetical protein